MSKRNRGARNVPKQPQQPGLAPVTVKAPSKGGGGAAQRRRKVAIVGFTPSRAQAPYDDDTYEIWGLNALFRVDGVPRATRWFDLHPADKIPEDRVKWYAEAKIPVYLQRAHPSVPMSMPFPREAILARFGKDAYFTNSISWMIALAMLEGMTHIEVYGVDMSTPDEYRTQRPNVEYWLGLAQGAGIQVKVAETSDLLKSTHEYGYGDDGGLRKKVKERIGDFTGRIQKCDKAIAEHGTEIRRLELTKATLEGARQDANWFIQSWGIYEGGSEEGRTFQKPGPNAPAKTTPETVIVPPVQLAPPEADALAAEVQELTGAPEIEPVDAPSPEPEEEKAPEPEAEAQPPLIPDEDEVAEQYDEMGIKEGAAV